MKNSIQNFNKDLNGSTLTQIENIIYHKYMMIMN